MDIDHPRSMLMTKHLTMPEIFVSVHAVISLVIGGNRGKGDNPSGLFFFLLSGSSKLYYLPILKHCYWKGMDFGNVIVQRFIPAKRREQ